METSLGRWTHTSCVIFWVGCGMCELGLDTSEIPIIPIFPLSMLFAVQASCVPKAMAGYDMLIQGPSSTGKTASFILPMLHHIRDFSPGGPIQGIVLVPTIELGYQVILFMWFALRFTVSSTFHHWVGALIGSGQVAANFKYFGKHIFGDPTGPSKVKCLLASTDIDPQDPPKIVLGTIPATKGVRILSSKKRIGLFT